MNASPKICRCLRYVFQRSKGAVKRIATSVSAT